MPDGALHVDGVPRDDGGHDEVEATGSVLLAFQGSIAKSAEAMEAWGVGEGVGAPISHTVSSDPGGCSLPPVTASVSSADRDGVKLQGVWLVGDGD